MNQSGNLYLLVGASGAGKSLLAAEMAKEGMEVFRKTTTRPSRSADVFNDNEFDQRLEDLRGNEQMLAYYYNQQAYGINLCDLKAKLKQGRNVIMVTNDHLATDVLKRVFRGRAMTVFIHRDFSFKDLGQIVRARKIDISWAEDEEEIRQEQLRRWTARETQYDQLNAGRFQPDYVVINDLVEAAKSQLRKIIELGRPRAASRKRAAKLHLILAGTGKYKDMLLHLVESIPGGRRFLVPKYTERPKREDDGAEIRCVPKLPAGALAYSFFGNRYGVDLPEVKRLVKQAGLGFLTVSHIPTAKKVFDEMRQVGIDVKLWYLHQPRPDLSVYPPTERGLRERHYFELLTMYQRELIVGQGCGVILPVSNVTSLSSWVLSKMLEAGVKFFG